MLKYFLGFVFLLAMSVLVTSQYERNAHNPTPHSANGGSPAITATHAPESTADAEEAERKHPAWNLAYQVIGWPIGITVWALFFTLMAIADQTRHTARAAKSTEDSVTISRETAKRQLRAYIEVIVGDAMWQEREKGYRFGALPIVRNSGQTPAYKLRFVAKAAILPLDLPKDYFLSEVGDEVGETILGINQPMTMHAKVDDFVHDGDVQSIKDGDREKCLYAWGVVRYVDCFGDAHFTRFCHRLIWLPDGGKVYGYYIPGRNDAD
jgi:hypothetical protein